MTWHPLAEGWQTCGVPIQQQVVIVGEVTTWCDGAIHTLTALEAAAAIAAVVLLLWLVLGVSRSVLVGYYGHAC